MDAGYLTHPNVQIALHRDEARGAYLLGVVLHGQFIPFVERKLGNVDKWVAIGREQEQQATQQPPPTQPPTPTQ